MGSYKLLMQLLPPRDELLFSKASVSCCLKVFIFCSRSYQRSSGLVRSSAREPGQKIVPQGTLHCELESWLPALGLGLLVVSKPITPGILLLFLKQLRTWVGFCFSLRGTQICQCWVPVAEGRESLTHLSPLAHMDVSFERSGDSVSNELLNWEILSEHSVVLLVTRGPVFICLLTFINPLPK